MGGSDLDENAGSVLSDNQQLEAREAAGLAYDIAKRAARLKSAKAAHDDLVAAAHRAQADALEIEAVAKRRLADEYDAAQARGEVKRNGDDLSSVEDRNTASTADLGLRRNQIHEARQLRDAETADPGIVRRTLDERLDRGEEPTRAALRKMVTLLDGGYESRLQPNHKPERLDSGFTPKLTIERQLSRLG